MIDRRFSGTNPLFAVVLLSVAGLLLAGCSDLRRTFGMAKSSGPDEFAVVTRAPLTIPPDFGLRPPRPGAERPNVVTPREEARSTILGQPASRSDAQGGAPGGTQRTALADSRSPAEIAFLQEAGALNVDPEIRYVLERERGLVNEDPSLVERLVFWKKSEPGVTVVDPALEAQRLRENAALGKPPTAGPTPTK